MEIKITRTDASNPDFIALVRALDAELAVRDGDDHAFYHQFNQIDMIRNAVVLYGNGQACACGAFKPYEGQTAEVKRMYVLPEFRKMGLASKVLAEVENWARESGYDRVILETGQNQPEAIAMYTRRGYTQISNYGQYAGIENSVCFEKLFEPPQTNPDNFKPH